MVLLSRSGLFPGQIKVFRKIYPILDEIECQYTTSEGRFRGMIQRWLNHEGHPPSWRRLIYSLDCAGDITVADPIRGFAEPPPGESSRSYWVLLKFACSYASVILAVIPVFHDMNDIILSHSFTPSLV